MVNNRAVFKNFKYDTIFTTVKKLLFLQIPSDNLFRNLNSFEKLLRKGVIFWAKIDLYLVKTYD